MQMTSVDALSIAVVHSSQEEGRIMRMTSRVPRLARGSPANQASLRTHTGRRKISRAGARRSRSAPHEKEKENGPRSPTHYVMPTWTFVSRRARPAKATCVQPSIGWPVDKRETRRREKTAMTAPRRPIRAKACNTRAPLGTPAQPSSRPISSRCPLGSSSGTSTGEANSDVSTRA